MDNALLILKLVGFAAAGYIVFMAARTMLDPDWAWRRTQRRLQAHGITNSERTSQWENRSQTSGCITLIAGIVLAFAALII